MNDELVTEFTAEITNMKIKDPSANKDVLWARLGVIGMAIGVAITIIGFVLSHGTESPLEQNDFLIVALIGIAVTIAAAAVYVRAAMAQFLRFWMARLIYEKRLR